MALLLATLSCFDRKYFSVQRTSAEVPLENGDKQYLVSYAVVIDPAKIVSKKENNALKLKKVPGVDTGTYFMYWKEFTKVENPFVFLKIDIMPDSFFDEHPNMLVEALIDVDDATSIGTISRKAISIVGKDEKNVLQVVEKDGVQYFGWDFG